MNDERAAERDRASAMGGPRADRDGNGRPPLPLRSRVHRLLGPFSGKPRSPRRSSRFVPWCPSRRRKAGRPCAWRRCGSRSSSHRSVRTRSVWIRCPSARRFRTDICDATLSVGGKTFAAFQLEFAGRRDSPMIDAVFHHRGRSARPAARIGVRTRAIRGGRSARDRLARTVRELFRGCPRGAHRPVRHRLPRFIRKRGRRPDPEAPRRLLPLPPFPRNLHRRGHAPLDGSPPPGHGVHPPERSAGRSPRPVTRSR